MVSCLSLFVFSIKRMVVNKWLLDRPIAIVPFFGLLTL